MLELLFFFYFFFVITPDVGNYNKGDLLSVIYTYGPDGFAQDCVVPRNPNVMGYPFPPNTRAVSSSFPLFFLFFPFPFLF